MDSASQVGRGLRSRLLLSALLLAQTLGAVTYYVTVAGIGGEPDYEQRFQLWAGDADKSLKASGAQVQTLQGAGATRAALKSALEQVARQAKPEDSVVLMLIGHGSFDGTDYKFNLPGPDITAGDLAGLLNQIHAGRQLVVNMTSASGASTAAFKHANRVVITATRSGQDKNATTFARFWIEALRDEAADVDKNEAITALEAYRYAERKTKGFFSEQKRILTEHAQLDDEAHAGQFVLLRRGATALAMDNPAKKSLVQQKEAIENQIDQLKFDKGTLPPELYKQRLTILLVQLARVQEEIEK
jgi:hypothetical protein